jgi:hypothetical protein
MINGSDLHKVVMERIAFLHQFFSYTFTNLIYIFSIGLNQMSSPNIYIFIALNNPINQSVNSQKCLLVVYDSNDDYKLVSYPSIES